MNKLKITGYQKENWKGIFGIQDLCEWRGSCNMQVPLVDNSVSWNSWTLKRYSWEYIKIVKPFIHTNLPDFAMPALVSPQN